MDTRRLQRVSEAIREELTEIVGYELSDPRLGNVAVTQVHVSPDLRHARIRVQAPGDEETRRSAMEALENARGFLRRQLAERIDLFRIPDLHFEAEDVPDSARLETLFKRIRKGRPKPDPAPPDEKKPAS